MVRFQFLPQGYKKSDHSSLVADSKFYKKLCPCTFGIRKIVEPSSAVVVGPGRAAAAELEVAAAGLA